MMTGYRNLISDPLAHTVFDLLRRVGHDCADGQTVRVEGAEYGVTAHAVCTLQLVHVVTEQIEGPGTGYQRAMVVLEVKKNGYPGMDGAAHLMPALLDGLVIEDPLQPSRHAWRFLPCVEMPRCFMDSTDGEAA